MKKAVAIAVLAFLALAAFFAWDYFQREAMLREQIRQYQQVVARLDAEYRVAQVIVRDQTTDASGQLQTTIEFRELDRQGNPLPPVTATLSGAEAYFEALVVKFENKYVEQGEALRGKSIILFRRMFGSATAPDAGVPIDPAASDGVPSLYRVAASPSDMEIRLWARFWYYANHPREAQDQFGVRVMQLEAVGTRVYPNMTYELNVENDGGINLVPLTAMPQK